MGNEILKPNEKPIYWLDEILCGGIKYHEQDIDDDTRKETYKPIVVLISGPPGAGKSLLLQQICYMIGLHDVQNNLDNPETWQRMVIISVDAGAKTTVKNLDNLKMPAEVDGKKIVFYYDYVFQKSSKKPDIKFSLPDPKPPLTILSPYSSDGPWQIDTFMDAVNLGWKCIGRATHPKIIAIDSLNIMERTKVTKTSGHQHKPEKESDSMGESIGSLYDRILHRMPCPPSVLILVLDTPEIAESSFFTGHRHWEYLSDVVIRVDYTHEFDYYTRHLEVIKTRYQNHTLGKQLFKIFPPPDSDEQNKIIPDREGARPYITRGGLFVFPSEHLILSKIRTGKKLIHVRPKRPKLKWASPILNTVDDCRPVASGPGDLAPPLFIMKQEGEPVDWDSKYVTLNWPIQWCYEMNGSGIPLNQTTAIIGNRGLHKSYFAYQFILDGIANEENTLTISFRDNENDVNSTLQRISCAPQYKNLITTGKIETYNSVIYQRPGYVTSQEFLHRVITYVGEHAPTRVIINAIDQWYAAYPLLEKSKIIVPALIDFLNSHEATTIIIGVNSLHQPLENTGLTSKVEVVISFDYVELPWPVNMSKANYRESRSCREDGYPKSTKLLRLSSKEEYNSQPMVVARAVRVPHGNAGLARAVIKYLEIESDDPAGLELIPLAPEYPMGKNL